MRLPEQFTPTPYISGDIPDWHAAILREIARQLGVGSDAYYPLLGAANKIEMFRGELRKMRDDLDESECFPTTCAMIANKIDDLLSNRDE